MKAPHRSAHRGLWLLLFPLILAGLFLAVQARNPVPAQAAPFPEDLPQSMPPAVEVPSK